MSFFGYLLVNLYFALEEMEVFLTVIQIKNLNFSYESGLAPIFSNINLDFDSSWKLGIIGRNGRGKTTLLKILSGDLIGQGEIVTNLNFVYFPKFISNKNLLTIDVLTQNQEFPLWKLECEFMKLALNPEALHRHFNTLSGGEQTKALLAVLFLKENVFPLLDEPTNHLDLKTRQIIAKYLKNKKQGFIIVSHDRSFIDATVDHVAAIERTQMIVHQGNYSVYEEEKSMRDHYEAEKNKTLKKEIGRLKKTASDKEQWSKRREKDKHGDRHIKNSGLIVNKDQISARAKRVMKKAKNLEHRMEKRIKEKKGLLKDIEVTSELQMNYQPDVHKKFIINSKLGFILF